jgi:uncharacterized protein YraI
MRLIHRIGISAAALVATSAAAFAAPALTLSDLNMRAGRGTDSPVVITVPGGSTVDVFGCDPSGGCSIRYGRFAGFMNQAYLGMGGGPGYGSPPPPVMYAPPPPPVVVYPGCAGVGAGGAGETRSIRRNAIFFAAVFRQMHATRAFP